MDPLAESPSVIKIEVSSLKSDLKSLKWILQSLSFLLCKLTFLALSRQGNIIYNVDLQEGQTYNFKVRAKEWSQNNSDGPFSPTPNGRFGFWGLDSDLYQGSPGYTDTAARNMMTITLLRRY